MFPLRVLTTIFRTGSDIRSDYRFHSTREKVNALLHDLEKNSSISFDNFNVSFLEISKNDMQIKSIKIKIDKKLSSKKKFII